jgi:hypothetical protein
MKIAMNNGIKWPFGQIYIYIHPMSDPFVSDLGQVLIFAMP